MARWDSGIRDSGIRKMQEALCDAANAPPGSLRMSSSGARRSRAGSQKGDVVEDKKADSVAGDVETDKKSSSSGPKPDGRVCKTCPRKDSDEDPVDKALGKACFMCWGYPPWPNGCTRGDQCYYCIRVYLREGKAMGQTISA